MKALALPLDLVTKGPGLIDRLPTDGLMGWARPARLATDDGLMMCRGTLSTQDLDRSRDVVIGKALDLANHRRLPMALLLHRQDLPVGRTEHPKTKEYRLWPDGPDGSRLKVEIFFAQDVEAGEQAYRLVKSGLLNGLSIGFKPDPRLIRKSTAPDGRPCTLVGGGELFEVSLVVFPDNPHCTVDVCEVVTKGFGGKPLVPELREALQPMLPALKAWSAGWGAGLRRKAAYGGPGAQPAPLADDPMTPADESPANDAGPQLPAGAQALQGAYEWLTGHADFMEQAAAVNEHPEVKAVIARMQADLAKWVATIASAFNKTYPDLPNLDPGTGYAQPAPDAPDAPADPSADPDARPVPDEPDTELDEDGDATAGMDEDEKKEYKAARKALRRLVTKHLADLTARRRLADAQRESVARVADRLAEYPGSRATARWAAKQLRAALAGKGAAVTRAAPEAPAAATATVAEPAAPAAAIDLARVREALAPLSQKMAAMAGDVAAITGRSAT